jgi:predicted nucleic-acid-binding Zn-ribbon protein
MGTRHLMEIHDFVVITCKSCRYATNIAVYNYHPDMLTVIPCPKCGSLSTEHWPARFVLGKYRVTCRTDRERDGSKGKYVLATSRDFDNIEEAAEYADTVSPSREAEVLMIVDKFFE